MTKYEKEVEEFRLYPSKFYDRQLWRFGTLAVSTVGVNFYSRSLVLTLVSTVAAFIFVMIGIHLGKCYELERQMRTISVFVDASYFKQSPQELLYGLANAIRAQGGHVDIDEVEVKE